MMRCDKCCDKMEPGVLMRAQRRGRGFSPCMGKSGKALQRRGHLGCASKGSQNWGGWEGSPGRGNIFQKGMEHEGTQ